MLQYTNDTSSNKAEQTLAMKATLLLALWGSYVFHLERVSVGHLPAGKLKLVTSLL